MLPPSRDTAKQSKVTRKTRETFFCVGSISIDLMTLDVVRRAQIVWFILQQLRCKIKRIANRCNWCSSFLLFHLGYSAIVSIALSALQQGNVSTMTDTSIGIKLIRYKTHWSIDSVVIFSKIRLQSLDMVLRDTSKTEPGLTGAQDWAAPAKVCDGERTTFQRY